jgi:hypothetical protein
VLVGALAAHEPRDSAKKQQARIATTNTSMIATATATTSPKATIF